VDRIPGINFESSKHPVSFCSDPDSKAFRGTATKYVDFRRYQIARSKARFQRAFNYASGVSPRPPVSTAEKRKAPLVRVPGEGGPLKKRKETPAVKKEEKGLEKVKVKRFRKKKERVVEGEVKEKESEKKEGDGSSTDEDVPLHKRMKFSPAESGESFGTMRRSFYECGQGRLSCKNVVWSDVLRILWRAYSSEHLALCAW
jgi:hypothetical protein